MKNQKNDMMRVKVSVIIPTYNCMTYLPDAISCVARQGLGNYEVLIADDNSTDGTWDWLLDQQRRDIRIRPIKLSGVGPSRARNTCILASHGEYIAFLDADDCWHDYKLAAQIKFMDKHPDMTMSFTNYQHVGMHGEDLGTSFNFWPRFKNSSAGKIGFHILPNALATIFAENVVGTSSVIARQNALQIANGYDENLDNSEDWDLWLKLASQGSVGYSTQVLMNYLMRPDSETSKSDRRIRNVEKIFNRHRANVEKLDTAVIPVAQARLSVARAERCRKTGDYAHAFAHHLQAIRLSPCKRTLRAIVSDAINIVRYRFSSTPARV